MRPCLLPVLLPVLLVAAAPALAGSEHHDFALEDGIDVTDPLAYGEYLFENCIPCHGEDGSEGSGGDIRGSDARLVKKMTTAGLEGMPEFDFEAPEIDALVAWLAAL